MRASTLTTFHDLEFSYREQPRHLNPPAGKHNSHPVDNVSPQGMPLWITFGDLDDRDICPRQ